MEKLATYRNRNKFTIVCVERQIVNYIFGKDL